MAGKRSSLRAGEVVELQPGLFGRLNKEEQKLELSDGRRLSLNEQDKRELFPSSEPQRLLSEQKEEIERDIKKVPFGEFFHQFGQKGAIGGIKDLGERYLSGRTDEEYQRLKQAQHEVGQRISKESPWTSRSATVASIIPEIALTKGMSAARAAPVLTGLSAGSRIFEEPGQVALEAGLASAGGKILDIGANKLSKMAARRAATRNLPAQQAEVRAQNLAGEAATAEANAQQREAFNALKQRVSNENEALLHQHNLTLNERQNRMIQAKNSYEQAKANRESEIFRLENEYKTAKAERSANATRLENEYKQAKSAAEQETKRLNDEYQLAQKQYQESLKDLPRLQREAQAEYGRNVVRNVEEIQKVFPKDARIVGKQIGVQDFIDESINSTGLAGSREGSQASRILKSLFPEGEFLTARELSKRYQAIEDAIQRASPEVQGVLNQFKNHLGQKLPVILEDTIAHSKIMPSLLKKLEKDVASVIHEIPFGKGEETTRSLLTKRAEMNLKQVAREITPENFVQKLQSGEIQKRLREGILSAEDFLTDQGFSNFSKLRKEGMYDLAMKSLGEKHNFFMNEMDRRINNTLARNEIKAMQAGKEAAKKMGKSVKGTYGLAEPVAPPSAPMAPEPLPLPQAPIEAAPIGRPNLPPPVAPPQELPLPQKPFLRGEPTPPTPQSFLAQPEPTLAPPSGMGEKLADALEKPLFKGQGTTNNLLKLGALKYALGPAALPLEAAALGGYGALKTLTSPGAIGEAARMSFKQGGIQAIEALAQKYPSYRNGILESPQERRSLTKEIEDDPEIPIEQKAILQSKVNRGKPLGERLQ